MILKFPYFVDTYNGPYIPYPASYLEGMHTWSVTKKFAFRPRRLYEFENRSSIFMGGLAPDEYRYFTGTEKFVWLEPFIQIVAYPRMDILKSPPHPRYSFAVDPYFYTLSLMK